MAATKPGIWHLVTAIALVVLGIVVYGVSLSGGFLDWDDQTYIVKNPELRRPIVESVPSIFSSSLLACYSPVHRLGNLLQWKLFGGDPRGFRATSLFLHLLTAFLLYLFLAEWLSRRLPAAVAAALFVVHPGNVENVAWISEQKTLLATAFAVGALLFYMKGARSSGKGTGPAVALFTLGLLAKVTIIALPALLFLLDLSIRRAPSLRRYLVFLAPAVVVGVAQLLAAAGDHGVAPWHGGTPLTHAGTVVGVMPRYAQALVYPSDLTPTHPFSAIKSVTDLRFLLGVGLLVAAAAATLLSLSRRRRWLLAVPWFFAALLPTLVVPIPVAYAERFLYFAMPLLLGVVAVTVIPRKGAARIGGALALVAAGVVMALSAADYAAAWKTPQTLWTRATTVHPDHSKGWGMLAWSRLRSHDYDGASAAFRRYLTLRPGDNLARVDQAVAEYQAGRKEEAQRLLEALVRDEPTFRIGWVKLAQTRKLRGDEEGARRAHAQAQKLPE